MNNLGNLLNNTGVDALMGNQDRDLSVLPLDTIFASVQIRKTFDTDDSSIAELSESIKQLGVLQPILVRPVGDKFEIVAGERRYRAAKLAGLESIPAHIAELTDEEAADAQLAENIQRANLTMYEEAEKLQKDLDELGSTEALLAKINKSHSWLSKRLGLLKLPAEAKRLIDENISADLEVINDVKAIAKVDPVAADKLVDELKADKKEEAKQVVAAKTETQSTGKPAKAPDENTGKKGSAREKAKAVKAEVKPTTKNNPETQKKAAEKAAAKAAAAAPKKADKPVVKADAKIEAYDWVKAKEIHHLDEMVGESVKRLETIYDKMANQGMSFEDCIAEETKPNQDLIKADLEQYFKLGSECNNVSVAILSGFNSNVFSNKGVGAFYMAAFLLGTSDEDKMNIKHVLNSVEKSLT